VPNPPVDQVVALADVFGSILVLSRERQEAAAARRGSDAPCGREDERHTAHIRLPDREKEMILGIIKQFEDLRETPG